VGDGKRARWKPTPDPHYAGSGYRHGKTHGVNAAPQGDGCLEQSGLTFTHTSGNGYPMYLACVAERIGNLE
jgi:hypothetical protein